MLGTRDDLHSIDDDTQHRITIVWCSPHMKKGGGSSEGFF